MKDQSLSGGMFLFRHIENMIKRHWIFFLIQRRGRGRKRYREERREREGEGRQYHGIKRNDQIETSIISKC